MGQGGWKYHPECPETGWHPGQQLWRLQDEGDRIWFMPYEYVDESKHHVRLIVGNRSFHPLPRTVLKTDPEVRLLHPSRERAVIAFLQSKRHKLERMIESTEEQKRDISRVLRLLAEAAPEVLDNADNADYADFVTPGGPGEGLEV